jgi:hypothetical protein
MSAVNWPPPSPQAFNQASRKGKFDWRIQWEKENGVHTAYNTARSEDKRHQVVHKSFFATIRPAHNGEGLLDSAHGYVVTRKEFDDLREFATLDEAKLYVESIYELERKD